jgi:hypothetical protein
MKYKSDHNYESFAGQESMWHPFDSKERYENNLKNDYARLKQFGWLENQNFTYKFNSYGFRCNEFNDDAGIVFLGCSHTVGVGLPLEQTFSQIISKQLNLQCINLAVPATSNDTAFRLACHWIPKMKPKIVVMMSPDPARFELITQDNKINFMPRPIPSKKYEGFYNDWVFNDDNMLLNQEKNKAGVEILSQKNSAKFIFIDALTTIDYVDYGRDLWHSGVQCNRYIANIILSKIS